MQTFNKNELQNFSYHFSLDSTRGQYVQSHLMAIYQREFPPLYPHPKQNGLNESKNGKVCVAYPDN